MAHETPSEHRFTADQETIREWADDHGMVPVRRTEAGESTVGLAPRSDADDYERLDWEEFHEEMGRSNRVVVHRGDEAERTLDVRDRDETIERVDLDSDEVEESLVEGEVVTGQITETTVVETTIVEEADLESELVDTEIVDERIAEVELESRECTGCTTVDTAGAGATDWFDTDHYLEARDDDGLVGGHEVDVEMAPYGAELDVEERYRVTREVDERFTIETRIADTDVTEMDTIESQDIDVEGLQQSIVESDFVDIEGETEVVADYDIETEFVEDDRMHTFIDRQTTVEDVIRDRKQVRADITDVTDHEMELLESEKLETTTTSELEGEEAMVGTDEATMDDEAMMAEEGEFRTVPTADDEGKDVVDATGDEVGMVVEVDEAQGIAYVDPHPGITERIKAKMDWGDADEEDFPLQAERIERISDDSVEIAEETPFDEDDLT